MKKTLFLVRGVLRGAIFCTSYGYAIDFIVLFNGYLFPVIAFKERDLITVFRDTFARYKQTALMLISFAKNTRMYS